MSTIALAFLRNRGDVLFQQAATATDTPHWTVHTTDVGANEQPLTAARRAVTTDIGVDVNAVSLAYAGEPLSASTVAGEQTAYPFMFDTTTRSTTTSNPTEWCPPTEMLTRETPPWLWEAYQAVAPTSASIAADEEHGSAELSIRALSALRDTAAVADEMAAVHATARSLVNARPTMAVVSNRINRVLSEAPSTPREVHDRATEAIDAAGTADRRAAQNVIEHLSGTVLTLSRSGTVIDALIRAGHPTMVTESRPACEGVTTAEKLVRAGIDVTVTTDAAAAMHIGNGAVDAVLVGADTILPNGDVVNKVGTRSLMLAAADASIPRYVVSAQDKIAPELEFYQEDGDREDLYTGPESLTVSNPLFDRTSSELLSGVITETGLLTQRDIEMVAAQHRSNATWDEH